MIKKFLLSLLVICSFHISCYALIYNEQREKTSEFLPKM